MKTGYFRARVEVPWLDHPRVHHHAVPDIQLQKLRGAGNRGLGPAPDLGVVLQNPNDAVVREADQGGDRGSVECGIRVKGPPKVGREVVEVGSRLVRGRDPLGLFGAVQADTVEVALGGIVGRGEEVEPAISPVGLPAGNRPALHYIAGPRGQEPLLAPVARIDPGVAPPVLFGQEEEGVAPPDPLQAGVQPIAGDDPGRIGLVVDPVDLTRAHVGDEEVPFVPKPAELLHQKLLGVPGPAHLPEIEALGRGRDGDPADFRALGVHHAHPEPGDGLAHPREPDLPELRIRGVGGDEHGPHPHPGGVGLDEGDAAAVGAPYGAAVGDGFGGGVGQAGRSSGRDVVDVKVAVTAEEDAASFRGDGASGARLHPLQRGGGGFEHPEAVGVGLGGAPRCRPGRTGSWRYSGAPSDRRA